MDRDVVYIYTMEYYYSAIDKNEIVPFTATGMQLESIKLTEVSQKEKDRLYMASFILSLCSC